MTGTRTRTRTTIDALKLIYLIMLKYEGRARQNGDSLTLTHSKDDLRYTEEFFIDIEGGRIIHESVTNITRS